MSMIKEFKDFAMKGNVVDMAVGVIIGGAFGKIIASLVNDVIMPPIGMLMGNVDFSDLGFVLKPAEGDAKAVVLKYGVFVNEVVNFAIVAFAIFMMIKLLNSFKKAEAPAAPTTKACGQCLSNIPLKATKCAFCTSVA
ncbi:MAG: large-conductance mechanosensitive channel protein MscL [Elusimicrobiota bacterium]